MPIEVLCPSCETKLRVKDEVAGRIAACPRCGQKLRIPGAPAAAQAGRARADDLDRTETDFGQTFSPDPLRTDATAGPSSSADWSWETLRTGLRIVHGGSLTGLCGTVAFGLGTLGMQLVVSTALSGGGGGGGGMGGFLFWTMLIAAGVLAGYSQLVVMLTGWACCRAAPAEIPEATRTWATLAVVTGGSGIAAFFGMFMLPQLGGGTDVAGTLIKLITFVSISAVLAGYACFGGFLRGLGEHFRDPGLRVQSLYFMLFVGAVGVWMLLQLFVFGEGSGRIPRNSLFPGAASGLVNLLIQTGIGLAHFWWLRDLARKAARQVDFHMRSM